MKNIFLIGDSIRFGANPDESPSPGYGVIVKEKLSGKVNVYAPNENCRFAGYTLRYLHEWASNVPKQDIDVVHWNNGLWDVLRLFGDEPFTDIESYGLMLKRVYKRIKFLFPNAKVVFALNSRVMEEKASKDFFRRNCDIEKYNEKAIEVLSEFSDVTFNDLYFITSGFDSTYYVDWVHFTKEACTILADAVIDACYKAIK